MDKRLFELEYMHSVCFDTEQRQIVWYGLWSDVHYQCGEEFNMDLCAHRNDRLNIFLRLLWFLIFMAPTKLSFLWPANPGPPMLT